MRGLLNDKVVAGMAMSILARNYDEPKPTPKFHNEMWKLCCSKHKFVAIAAPRGHAKSSAITFSYLLAAVLTRDRKYVLIISDTEEQGAEFLHDIREELKNNDDLVQMWGIEGFQKESGTDIIVKMSDGHRFRIMAKGSEQRLRGRKWMGTRPDLIIGDDLENEELTDSDLRRAKLKRWFYGSVIPAGSDRCIYRIVGTVLHFDSLLESLMPQENDKRAIKTDLSIKVIPKSKQAWAAIKYQAHDPDFKNILWPEKFPQDRLEALKIEYQRQGIPEVYAQEYLNEPIAEDNAYFKPEDFLPMKEGHKNQRLEVYASADLAITKEKHSAFTCLTVAALNAEGHIMVLDVKRGRWDSLEIIDAIFDVQMEWEPNIFWMEDENIRKSIGPVLDREMRDRGVYINIETITPTKDKTQRARPLQARMRAKAMLFDKDQTWYFDLEKEMRRFPKSGWKDQVDALGLIPFGLNKMADPLSDFEAEEQDYYEEFGDEIQFGRDAMTGY